MNNKDKLIKVLDLYVRKLNRIKVEQLIINKVQEINALIIDSFHKYFIGRNELCSCGSGKKYKKCCGNK